MQDTKTCLICGDKMRSMNLPDKYLHFTDKTANYIERTCYKHFGHFFQIFTDKSNNQIDYMQLSFDHLRTRHVDINFINKNTTIKYANKTVNNQEFEIKVPKILETDFPNLDKLKEKLELYIRIS